MADFNSYLTLLRYGVYQVVGKIDILRSDETIQQTIIGDIVDGSINITRINGCRRSCSVTLTNIDNKYKIDQYSPFFINRKFQLWLGLKPPDTSGFDDVYFISQGVFCVRSPQIESFNSGSTIRLDGVDKWYNLEKTLGLLPSAYIIPKNTDVNNAIRAILNIYVDSPRNQMKIDTKSPILQSISAPYDVTPYTIKEEIGSNYAKILLSLAGINSYNIFYDVNGRLVTEQDINDSIKGSQWNFTDNEFLYLGATHDFLYEDLRNHVKVIGNNVNGKIFKGEKKNTNTQSSTNIYNIGTRLEVYESDVLNTDALCQIRAEYMLKRLNVLQSAISIRCPNVLLHLDVDKVVTLTDGRLSLENSRFLIKDISRPLMPNQEMTVSCVKTDELGITL